MTATVARNMTAPKVNPLARNPEPTARKTPPALNQILARPTARKAAPTARTAKVAPTARTAKVVPTVKNVRIAKAARVVAKKMPTARKIAKRTASPELRASIKQSFLTNPQSTRHPGTDNVRGVFYWYDGHVKYLW